MSTEHESALDAGGWVTPRGARPLETLGRILRLPGLVRAHFDLVRTTLRRDLMARFQGTLLGWAWPVLQPLFLFGIYYFIFTGLLQQRMPGLSDEQRAGMGVYMFCGMLAWSALAESITRGTTVIVDNGNLIKKLSFPSELLPLNVVLTALVMLCFALAIFVVVALTTPVWPAPGLSLAWVPLLLVLQGLFAYGLVLFFSTLQVFLRDTAQLLAMVTTVWMFVTPIFWVPELLPIERYAALMRTNPAYHMVAAWRGALMGDVSLALDGGRVLTPVSSAAVPGHVAVFAAWALGAYAAGYAFFVFSQRRFADEV